MKNKIIIKCTDAFDFADWMLVTSKGEITSKTEHEALNTLSQKVALNRHQVIILVASSDIVIRQVTLPKKINQKYMAKILPNMLEEDLNSNINSLHFSYGKTNNSTIPIAIIAQEKLNKWLDQLKSYHIEADSIHPISLALKNSDEKWQVWVDNDLSIVKTQKSMGYHIENKHLPFMLDLLYKNQESKPLSIQINTKDEALLQQIHFDQYPDLLALINQQQSTFWDIYNPAIPSINLLQQDFTKKFKFNQHKKLFIHASIILTLFMVTLLGFFVRDIIDYGNIKQNQQVAIENLYRSIYPNATAVVSPKMRMERDLTQSTKANNDFFDLLFLTAPILHKSNNISLNNLSYKQGSIILNLEAKNYADIEQLVRELKKNQLNVTQDKTEQQKSKLSATFIVSRSKSK